MSDINSIRVSQLPQIASTEDGDRVVTLDVSEGATGIVGTARKDELLSSVNNRIDTNESSITANSDRIDTAEEDIDNIEDAIGSVTDARLAREVGGTAYPNLLGFPLPPSLEWLAFRYKDEANGAPSEATFTRASSATFTNAVGEIETVGNDILRHDYDQSTGEYLGWLLEEERENLLTYSEQIDNVDWSKFGVTVTANVSISPDGTLSADRVVSDGISSADRIEQEISVSQNTDYILSAWYKSTGIDSNCRLNLRAEGGDPVEESSIISTTSEWTMHTVSINTGNNTILKVRPLRAIGESVDQSDIWGCQVEEGRFQTSYIPTTATPETRAADNLIIATADFPYNQNEGTLYVESNSFGGSTSFCSGLSDGTTDNYIALQYVTGNGDFSGSTFVVTNGQSYSSPLPTSGGFNQFDKIATAFDQSSVKTQYNNEELNHSGTYNGLSGVTILLIGNGGAGAFYDNTHIKHVAYFPRRLSDSDLQKLTS